jgi:hypothetical protein
MNNNMNHNTINQALTEKGSAPPQRVTDEGFAHRGEPFEKQYACFRAAIDQLKVAALSLDAFDLQVQLKWKKDPCKSTPAPDEVTFPELPRYVTDDVALMVEREERKQTPEYREYLLENVPESNGYLTLGTPIPPRGPMPLFDFDKARKERDEERKLRKDKKAMEEEQRALILKLSQANEKEIIDESDEELVALMELMETAKLDRMPDFQTLYDQKADELRLEEKKPDEPDRTT